MNQTQLILYLLSQSNYGLRFEQILALVRLRFPNTSKSTVNCLLWTLRRKGLIQRTGPKSKYEYRLSPEGEVMLASRADKAKEGGVPIPAPPSLGNL